MPRVIRRGLTIGALATLLSAVAVAGAAATVPEGPRLAFLRFGGHPPALEVVSTDPSGATAETIAGGRSGTHLPDPASPISWSPDGAQIAFAGSIGIAGHLNEPTGRAIFIAAADGGQPQQVPGTSGGELPVFAPDGGSIAYLRTRGQNSVSTTLGGKHKRTHESASIWLASLDGSVPRQLTPWRTRIYSLPSSFSPDGSALAITQNLTVSRTSRVVALPLDGGVPRVIAKDAAEPVYSPDGSRIALIRLRHFSRRYRSKDGRAHIVAGITTDLYVMNADGSGLKPLTRTTAIDETPAWDPSGQRLAYLRLGNAKDERAILGFGDALMEVNSDGTCDEEVIGTDVHTALLGPTWQPGPGREAGAIAC